MNRLEETIDLIVEMIADDVKAIENHDMKASLEEKERSALCRYATTLAGIRSEKVKVLDKEKESMSELSDEELKKILLEVEEIKKD